MANRKMKENLKIQRDKKGLFIKGHKVPKEVRIKISKANKGKHYSKKTEFRKGKPPWNKGLKEIYSKGTLQKMSESSKGIIPWHRGRIGVYSKETLKEMSESKKGNKNMLGKKHSVKSKTKMSASQKEHNKKHPERVEAFKKMRSKIKVPKQDSTIEVKIQNFLKELKIEFFTHQYMKIKHGYQCDILIPSMNLVIECDGDYWHKYPIGLERDHIRTKELIEKGFKVLRLWEFEIKAMELNEFKERIK